MAIRTPLRGRTRAQGEVARVSDRIVRVAAAVIRRPDGSVLLAQRPEGRVYAGYWEFPGGKLEPRESVVGALKRELREELGIDVLRAAPWITREYVYPHAHVELNFCRVLEWCGEPVGHDGQAFSWQRPGVKISIKDNYLYVTQSREVIVGVRDYVERLRDDLEARKNAAKQ